tara:strand:- start:13096 stop:15501 length:2406 start_codon:yes stop_codon:yes gene_type:complete
MNNFTFRVGFVRTTLLCLFISNTLCAQLSTVLEAEDQTLTHSYVLKPGSGNASNGSWILLKNNPNGSLELTVADIPVDGSYKLNCYNFNNNTSQEAELSINDGAAKTVALSPSNWEYEGGAGRTTFDVDLQAGTNSFTFTRMAQNLHFDYFTVSTKTSVLTYYLSNDGDDANNGLTEATPWKTLEKAKDATKRDGLLQPGSKLLFKKGDTFIGQLIIACSGTEEKPIEIGSYGAGELPILTGVGANLGSNGNGDAIEVVKMTNTSHILINDLHITNDREVGLGWQGSGNSSYGILVKATKLGGVSKGLTFRNLEFTDVFGADMLDWEGNFTLEYYKAQGFFFDSEADDTSVNPIIEVGINDVLIEECYFYNLGSTAISVRNLNPANNPISDGGRNENFVIRNNHFEKLGGDGVIFASVNNGLVENNEFIDLGWGDHSSQTDRYYGRGEGCWIWDSHNIMVQYNKQYRASGFGDTYAAGHVDFYCKNSVFQYNYSEDTEGGFVEILGNCENTIFRYNVSVNDGHRANGHHRYSIWLSGYVGSEQAPVPSNNSYIYNNTVYLDKTSSQPDINIFAKNTYIYNNLFYAMDGAQIGSGGVSIEIEPGSELLVSNNVFYGAIAAAFTDLDEDKVIGQDPLFTNPISDNGTVANFNIQDGSRAIDTGKSFLQPVFPNAGIGIFNDIPMYPTKDVFGNAIDIQNNAPNIGASNAFNSSILGVNDRVTKVFSIYPTLVKADLHVYFSNAQKNTTIQIYDVRGKLVYTTRVRNSDTHQQIQLPNTIKNGIYVVKIAMNTAVQTTQFILYN